jgi:hypothetical protein
LRERIVESAGDASAEFSASAIEQALRAGLRAFRRSNSRRRFVQENRTGAIPFPPHVRNIFTAR